MLVHQIARPLGDTPVRVLLIGQNSLLARATRAISSLDLLIDSVSHSTPLSEIAFDAYDVVLNMAYAPSYMRASYEEATDFDLKVAQHVAASNSFYVMISTRRVYGPAEAFSLTEDRIPSPVDHYGRNKLRTETTVQQLLGSRCTILRVANVFSFEPGRHTFFGIALQNLKENNQIVLDVSPFVARDFIHIKEFALILRRVLVCRPPGLYNLGSGKATEVGRIALWLIEGFGAGQLVISSPVERDAFELDMSKLLLKIGTLDHTMDIRGNCIDIGRTLRNG